MNESSLGSAADPLDIAIIGAGPGGLYGAYRLATDAKTALWTFQIFEATGQVGGRVRTLNVPEIPFTADIGAMRFLRKQVLISTLVDGLGLATFEHKVPLASYFVRGRHLLPPLPDDVHTDRVDAAAKLGVTSAPPGSNSQTTWLQEYLPRKTKSGKHTKNQTAYNLRGNRNERKLSPDEVLLHAICEVLRRIIIPEWTNAYIPGYRQKEFEVRQSEMSTANLSFEYFTIDEWRAVKQYGSVGSRMLRDYSLWEVVQLVLSPEAIAMARDCLGYQTIFGSWNAAEHIPWFLSEFGNAKYLAIDGGMSLLVNALDRELKKRHGDPVKFVHEVASIQRLSKGRVYKICFKAAEPCYARNILLSISKGALERIAFPAGITLTSELMGATGGTTLSEALGCISANPLMKAFVFFKEPFFWNKLHPDHKKGMAESRRCILVNPGEYVANGERVTWRVPGDGDFVCSKVLTDLPVRQLYFHGNHPVKGKLGWWRADRAHRSNIKGMIMAYCDAKDSEYWALIARRYKTKNDKYMSTEFAEALDKSPNRDDTIGWIGDHGVSSGFVDVFMDSASRLLSVLAGGKVKLPYPEVAFFQNWMDAPFYGGWHAWNMTYEPWLIRRHIRHPFNGERIYVAGEAVSADQGWIEGALRSVEAVLQSELGLGYPIVGDKTPEDSLVASAYPRPSDTREATLQNYLDW
jgi:hypothetical protein